MGGRMPVSQQSRVHVDQFRPLSVHVGRYVDGNGDENLVKNLSNVGFSLK